jgi:hypothetical protein
MKAKTSIPEIIEIFEKAKGGPLSCQTVGATTDNGVTPQTVRNYIKKAEKRGEPFLGIPFLGTCYLGRDNEYIDHIEQELLDYKKFKLSCYKNDRIRNMRALPALSKVEKDNKLPTAEKNERLFISDVTTCMNNSVERRGV